jgi:CRISPR-associated endonuclease/helicase Cas3
VIFILVATPVEEVGRDHDFDWAVVEPSSYRSFIQLAGRVLRHHDLTTDIDFANIALLQYNLKGLQGKEQVFCYPGYESEYHELETHDLQKLLAGETINQRLDAGPRIVKKPDLSPQSNLADLEHETLHKLLTNYQKQGPESLQGWLDGCWWLTAVPQVLVQFRAGSPQLPVFLMPEDGNWRFVEKDRFGKPAPIEKIYDISRDEELSAQAQTRLWLHRDYETLLKGLNKRSLVSAALIYGEIGLPTYGGDSAGPFIYSSQLGLMKK